jgi:hypothetical protein
MLPVLLQRHNRVGQRERRAPPPAEQLPAAHDYNWCNIIGNERFDH